MVFKLVMAAAKTWRRLKGEDQLPKSLQASHSETASRSSTRQSRTPLDPSVTQFRA
jgi:hypothetical protein